MDRKELSRRVFKRIDDDVGLTESQIEEVLVKFGEEILDCLIHRRKILVPNVGNFTTDDILFGSGITNGVKWEKPNRVLPKFKFPKSTINYVEKNAIVDDEVINKKIKKKNNKK